jgi:hypothetical protein
VDHVAGAVPYFKKTKKTRDAPTEVALGETPVGCSVAANLLQSDAIQNAHLVRSAANGAPWLCTSGGQSARSGRDYIHESRVSRPCGYAMAPAGSSLAGPLACPRGLSQLLPLLQILEIPDRLIRRT